jgi:flavin reductase (DIM6/NTAB) family NADH-FMN oxidoreductase RutF
LNTAYHIINSKEEWIFMKRVEYSEYTPVLIKQLSKGGVFLTARNKGEDNTMTIGWASAGIIWGKPILTVAVRYSRHTYEMLDKSGEFTVSVPAEKDMRKALAFCGSKSGRDYDKFSECGLEKIEGQSVNAPVIGGCELYYECRVVYRQAMEPALIDKGIDSRFYGNNDFHVLYYGEIVDCYIAE